MKPTTAQVEAGQAVYTRNLLSAYNLLVLCISNRYIWKCPSAHIESLYNAHVSANHLDVGVGTGYFLDRCRYSASHPRIALMDLNANSLAFASRRIERYSPETYRQNILEPLSPPLPQKPFDSIGINFLLHCLPGAIANKAVALDHLKPLMNPGARIFGSTIVQGGVPHSWLARKLMGLYNRKGIFANTEDDLHGLRAALTQRFDEVDIQVVGCVALFSARAG